MDKITDAKTEFRIKQWTKITEPDENSKNILDRYLDNAFSKLSILLSMSRQIIKKPLL